MPDSLECTLGVKIEGDSIDVYEIPAEVSTQDFSGIFDFKRASNRNIQGRYNVVIKEPKNGLSKIGMSIGNGWIITQADVVYGWGYISSFIYLEDSKGNNLERIKVWDTARPLPDKTLYFNASEIVKCIVSKAKEIVDSYPSVDAYNGLEQYKKAKDWLDKAPHHYSSNNEAPTPDEYMTAAEEYINHLREFVEIHNKVISLLEPSDDKRSKDLIEKLNSQLNALLLKKSLPLYR